MRQLPSPDTEPYQNSQDHKDPGNDPPRAHSFREGLTLVGMGKGPPSTNNKACADNADRHINSMIM